MSSMFKGLSLPQSNRYLDDGAFNVRSYAVNSSTQVIGLWVNWAAVDAGTGGVPASMEAAFQRWTDVTSPNRLEDRLGAVDDQIRNANNDGKYVVLTVYHNFPAWSHGAPAGLRGNQEVLGHYPSERGANSPWAWWVAWLCARYAVLAADNPYGPHLSPYPGENPSTYDIRYGNPRGVHVNWIQVMNEPNLNWWPQRAAFGQTSNANDIQCPVAEMVTSAEIAARPYEDLGGPTLLLPGTADVGQTTAYQNSTNYLVFTDSLLSVLRGWQTTAACGWAHHVYRDVTEGRLGDGDYRIDRVIRSLGREEFPFPFTYITEGGYHFPTSFSNGDYFIPDRDNHVKVQRANVKVHYQDMSPRTGVYRPRMWLQYQVDDANVEFQSSLRGEAASSTQPNPSPYRSSGTGPTTAFTLPPPRSDSRNGNRQSEAGECGVSGSGRRASESGRRCLADQGARQQL